MLHRKSLTSMFSNKQSKPRKSLKRTLAIENLQTRRLMAADLTATSSMLDLTDGTVEESTYPAGRCSLNFEEIKVTFTAVPPDLP